MDKADFAEQIISAIDGEEWELLDSGGPDSPVQGFYRDTLLELMDPYRFFDGDMSEENSWDLFNTLQMHLEETQPEKRAIHKYIIYAYMIRTYLDSLPMHPPEKVKYYTKARNGRAEYFCPKKDDSAVCSFCVARDCAPLYREWEREIAQTAEKYGEKAASIRKCILESGFTQVGIIKTKDLHFYEEVRKYCVENACHHFNTTWACPPAVGTVEECRERTLGFDYLHLFSKSFYLPDAVDWDSMKPAVTEFKKIVDELNSRLKPRQNGMMILSNDSCSLCKTCTYPDAPCRIPDKLHHSIEGYGFYVSELSKQAGVSYFSGSGIINLFGAVLHNG
ncbi:MAG: hypothetical protein IJJ50_07240 [Lachnospiraceae bacterium]|nr:hypothetical protein [Lachnospiraceae bacterium]